MQFMPYADAPSPVLKNKWVALVVATLLVLILYAALAFGIYNGLTRQQLGANDFYSRWMGARALLLRGQNPYAAEVTDEIQLGMYGQLARPDQDQVAFAYPLYAVVLAAPLVLLPYDAAQALWMAFLVVMVEAGVLALAVVNRIRLTPLALTGFVLGALLFYPAVRGIFLGNYALASFGLIALSGLAIARGHATMAGILLALATVKPQPVVLILPVVLFWAWMNGMRQLVASALLTLAVLIGVSFVLVPTWLGDFVNGLQSYAGYLPVGPPLETLYKLLLPAALVPVLTWVSGAVLLGVMVVLVWRDRGQSWLEFQPTLGFVGLVTTLLAVRIGTPDQMLLLILWVAWLGTSCSQGKRWGVAAGVAFLIIVPWLVFLQTLNGNLEALVVTTVLPWATLVVFCLAWVQHRRTMSKR